MRLINRTRVTGSACVFDRSTPKRASSETRERTLNERTFRAERKFLKPGRSNGADLCPRSRSNRWPSSIVGNGGHDEADRPRGRSSPRESEGRRETTSQPDRRPWILEAGVRGRRVQHGQRMQQRWKHRKRGEAVASW